MREMATLSGLDIGSHIAFRAEDQVFSGVLTRVQHDDRKKVFLTVESGPWTHFGHYDFAHLCVTATSMTNVSAAATALPATN